MNVKIPIAEFFGPTIQGEGPNVGVKTLFLRVAGCDFKCDWCDSKFTWTLTDNMNKYSNEDLIKIILDKVEKTHTSHIVLTGGNPCLYDFEKIILELKNKNIKVDIETQGSILPEWLNLCDTVVLSPKAPSSNMKDVYDKIEEWLNTSLSIPEIAIKIPVFNSEDFSFALRYHNLVEKYKNRYSIKFYLSVGNDDVIQDGDISSRILKRYEFLINEVIKNNLDNVFILPQLHTLVWGNRQGV